MDRSVVLCFGDSNAWGFDPATGERFPKDVRWPGVLAAELGDAFEVIEEGLPGRTIASDDPLRPGLAGLPYLRPCVLSHAPLDLVIFMLGTNDTKDQFGLAAVDIGRAMDAMVDLARSTGCGRGGGAPKVLIVAPAPVVGASEDMELWGFGGSEAKSRLLATLYRRVADGFPVAFFDAGTVAAVSPLDGVHLDAAGQAALGKALAGEVRVLLDRAG